MAQIKIFIGFIRLTIGELNVQTQYLVAECVWNNSIHIDGPPCHTRPNWTKHSHVSFIPSECVCVQWKCTEWGCTDSAFIRRANSLIALFLRRGGRDQRETAGENRETTAGVRFLIHFEKKMRKVRIEIMGVMMNNGWSLEREEEDGSDDEQYMEGFFLLKLIILIMIS